VPTNKKRKKIPSFKKNIKDFLRSEEGRISKKSMFRLGILATTSLFIAKPLISKRALAITSHVSHSSHASHSVHSVHDVHNIHDFHSEYSIHNIHSRHAVHSEYSIHSIHSRHDSSEIGAWKDSETICV
jgi:hypothetical protein